MRCIASGAGRMDAKKRARPQSMPTSEAVPRARLDHMGERAPGGASADGSRRGRDDGLAVVRRREEVWNVSEVASFSSR